MKMLVTGASGFLGTVLCSRLESEGHEVVKLNSQNCDLTKQDSLFNLNHMSYDQIFHLAAWTQAGDFCLHHQGEQWVKNQLINTNVLSWWHECQSQAKMICMGTSCAYSPDMELLEDNYLHGTPIDSLYTYAMTKRMLYVGLLALHKQFGLNYLYLVPSTLYGPGYHTDGRQMHFVFDLIRKILRGKLYDEPVVLWGDGYQRRELVYVEDFVSIMTGLNCKCDNEIVNIGAGCEYTIRDFAELICGILGYNFEQIQFDKTKYVGAKSKCLVINKLNILLADKSMTNIELGLRKTVGWFIQNKESILPNQAIE